MKQQVPILAVLTLTMVSSCVIFPSNRPESGIGVVREEGRLKVIVRSCPGSDVVEVRLSDQNGWLWKVASEGKGHSIFRQEIGVAPEGWKTDVPLKQSLAPNVSYGFGKTTSKGSMASVALVPLDLKDGMVLSDRGSVSEEEFMSANIGCLTRPSSASSVPPA